MKASDVLDPGVTATLLDAGHVRWTVGELFAHLTEAQGMIVSLRPDANAKNATVQLVGGTRQSIPLTVVVDGPVPGIRFLRANYNMTAGLVPGRAVRESSRMALDNELPDWHYAKPKLIVENYVFDNIDPKRFYVYPAVTGIPGELAPAWLDITYSGQPLPVSSLAQELDLGDEFRPALIDWVLYRAFSKDAQYAGNLPRAQSYLQSFNTALSLGMQSGFTASSPQLATPTPVATPTRAA